MNRTSRVLTGSGAALLLLLLVFGLPVGLAIAAGWPLPTTIPSWDGIASALTDGTIPESFFLRAIACVLWVAWLQVVASVVVELKAIAAGRSATRVLAVPGSTQILVARLVTTAAVLFTAMNVRATPATSLPPLPPPTAAVELIELTPEMAVSPAPVQPGTPRSAGKTWTVQRRQTLWGIAEQTLGDGRRCAEIFELNRGAPQPDGGALTDPERVEPGWVLVLPDDATVVSQPAPPAAYVVRAGDNLWDIAEDALGDGFASAELFDRNAGRPQPGGDSLRDPDLIQPGWVLELPDSRTSEAARPPTAPDPPAAATGPADISSTADKERKQEDAAQEAPTVSPASGSPAGTASDSGEGEPDELPLRAAVGVGLSAIAAAGVIWRLDLLRRVQLRRRRFGRAVVQPDETLEEVERGIRAVADYEAAAWVDACLRLLTVRSIDDEIQTLLGMRVGEFGVEVLLSTQAPAPSGFVSADDGFVWRVDPKLQLRDAEELGSSATPIAPGLVTLGGTPEGPVLVDLEALGSLAVSGDPERVDAFLAGISLELVTSPWSREVAVHVLALDPALAALDRITVHEAGDELAATVRAERDAASVALAGSSSTSARTRADAPDTWPPLIAVVGASAEDDHVLGEPPTAGCGVAVVSGRPDAEAPWRLVIDPGGTAVLWPLGLQLTAAGLDADGVRGAADLLRTAAERDDAPVVAEEAPSANEPVLDLIAEEQRGEVEIAVRVLGPVEVLGWSTPTARRKDELVVYLALHRERPPTSDRLRCALWPDGGVTYESFKQAVSRTRSALGNDVTGARHLPEAVDGTYRVGGAVQSDWEQFRTLVAAADRVAPSEEAALLRSALSLVRGEPFADVAPGSYSWAHSEQIVSEIEVAIVDVAARLATLALEAGDRATVEWAAAQGHLASPCHEGLYQLRMRAAQQAGDHDGVDQAFREVRRAVQALDPLDEVHPETLALYQQLSSLTSTIGEQIESR